MSNSIAPGSSADVNVRVTALTTNPNVPVTYKTIILKKNLVNGVNTLTQEMMSAQNTKYVVKYDYVIGEDVTIPANCVLEFDGGSISGAYTLTFNNTRLEGNVKFSGCIYAGTLSNYKVNINWFHNNSDDIADTLQYLISTARYITINKGLWYVCKSTKITNSDIIIKGEGQDVTTIKVTDTAAESNLWLLGTDYEYEWDYIDNVTIEDDMDISIRNIHISDITFDMNHGNISSSDLTPLRTYTLYLRNVENCLIERCSFVDDMEYGRNNGEPAITALLCKRIQVKDCISDNLTLFGWYHCINCKAMYNYCDWSVGTWLECDFGYGHKVCNNILAKGCFWGVSVIGINSTDCIVENNNITISNQQIETSPGIITLGHPNKPADRTIVRNNNLIGYKVLEGICGQNVKNAIIENNVIICLDTTNLEIGVRSGDNAFVINNILNISGKTNCTAISTAKLSVVSNNKITSNQLGIISGYGGTVTIEMNVITSVLRSIDVPTSCIVKNNKTNNSIHAGDAWNGPNHIIGNRITNDGTTFNSATLYIRSSVIPEVHDNIVTYPSGSTFTGTPFFIIGSDIFTNRSKYAKELFKNIYNNVFNNAEPTEFCIFSDNISQIILDKAAFDGIGATRPTMTDSQMVGYEFFDTNIKKPIYWDGSAWKDATGASV